MFIQMPFFVLELALDYHLKRSESESAVKHLRQRKAWAQDNE